MTIPTLDFLLEDLMKLGAEKARLQMTIPGDASAVTALERVEQFIQDRKMQIAAHNAELQ